MSVSNIRDCTVCVEYCTGERVKKAIIHSKCLNYRTFVRASHEENHETGILVYDVQYIRVLRNIYHIYILSVLQYLPREQYSWVYCTRFCFNGGLPVFFKKCFATKPRNRRQNAHFLKVSAEKTQLLVCFHSHLVIAKDEPVSQLFGEDRA